MDKDGNMMGTRTELTVSRLLDFLGISYERGAEVGGEKADFKTDAGVIQVVDGPEDEARFERISSACRAISVGPPGRAAKAGELGEMGSGGQTGSIFLDDPSFAFDYAHVLPLVEKCSILHGHTSRVMVELVGRTSDNLLLDFGEAKRIIREAVGRFDHKFFINSRYSEEDGDHYMVRFEGPRGRFDIRVPRDTAYMLEGEATVENLSEELVRILVPMMPGNIEAVGVHIYEGYNKGSHVVSKVR